MDFRLSDRAARMRDELADFMESEVFPAEPVYAEQRRALANTDSPNSLPPVVEELKAKARAQELWNLFLPLSRA